MSDVLIFNLARRLKRRWTKEGMAALTQAEVDEINAVLADWKKGAVQAPTAPPPAQGLGTGANAASGAGGAPAAAQGQLTAKVALELIGHEAIVQEMYLDSEGVKTWGVGVTNASGHSVDRYKDNPQPIARCLEVYIWLLREKYIPAVLKAFAGMDLTEAQFAGALSFHYNTGAIGKADWVIRFRAGDIAKARSHFMNWRNPPEIIPRREKERDLFFDGKWSGDGKAMVYPVRKPSYAPHWSQGKRVDVRAIIEGLLS